MTDPKLLDKNTKSDYDEICKVHEAFPNDKAKNEKPDIDHYDHKWYMRIAYSKKPWVVYVNRNTSTDDCEIIKAYKDIRIFTLKYLDHLPKDKRYIISQIGFELEQCIHIIKLRNNNDPYAKSISSLLEAIFPDKEYLFCTADNLRNL